MPTVPMFPLGSVLFPGVVLPLHVFEPRYRALMRDVLDGDRRFGVCLIERGAEVGGGDVRTGVGCMAEIQQAQQFPDGRWGVVTVGTERIIVERWLDDDPYPRADATPLPDPEPTIDELSTLPDVVAATRRALALAAELGQPAPPATVELSDEPTVASYQCAALAPVGTLDKQELLAARTVGVRLALLEAMLADGIELLELRLAAGEGPDDLG